MGKESNTKNSISKFYKISGDKVERIRRECPRCGKGVFMAVHKDRLTCGKCSYTEFQKDQTKKSK
ncbi:30S ribosomal protein S27ae [Candidatus Nitrosocosmicus franklandus]|uniref:Small ribosomal subunit protein eS31 n=1 Tax=Candidatus Nitrosocosmicus franklandianus TaxID=1798806 RepID=A0A484IDI6_9ARCH|nr:30S ribosomal protein S27ae [Candidatus Nitrosocosmicus franklandus]VFJ15446.1 30S ribosomal protein S27ae [Candidatus Nitrosocosmicus franklandus]